MPFPDAGEFSEKSEIYRNAPTPRTCARASPLRCFSTARPEAEALPRGHITSELFQSMFARTFAVLA